MYKYPKLLGFLLFAGMLLVASNVSAFTINRDLYQGISGSDVLELQRFLNNYGEQSMVADQGLGSEGMETEYYGYKTRMAVIGFQSTPSLGILDRDGIVRGTTRAVINNLLTTTPQSNYQSQSSNSTNTQTGYGLGGYSVSGNSPWGNSQTSNTQTTPPVQTYSIKVANIVPNHGASGVAVVVAASGLKTLGNYVLFQDKVVGPLASNGSSITFIVPATTSCGSDNVCSVVVTNSGGTSQPVRFILDRPQGQTTSYGQVYSRAVVTAFAANPSTVNHGQKADLVFTGEGVSYYSLRLECPKAVNASNMASQELCRATNVFKSGASPMQVLFSNSSAISQIAKIHLSAQDMLGNTILVEPINVTVNGNTTLTYTNTGSSVGPFDMKIYDVSEDGSSVISVPAGTSVYRAITVSASNSYNSSYSSNYAPATVALSVQSSYTPSSVVTLSQSVLNVWMGQSANSQLTLSPQMYMTAGDYRITITGQSGSYIQTKSFILRVTPGISNNVSVVNDLRVTGSGDRSVTLNWTDAERETGYDIYRSTDPNVTIGSSVTVPIALSLPAGTNTFTETTYTDSARGVTPMAVGTTYYYKLVVLGTSGNTSSNIVMGQSTGYYSGGNSLPDVTIYYTGPTTLYSGQQLSPTFTVRELNGVGASNPVVSVALYDPTYSNVNNQSIIGYEPRFFNDQNNVIALSQVSVLPNMSKSINLGSSYTFNSSGVRKVCASVDYENALQETNKTNNIACGTVTVQ